MKDRLVLETLLKEDITVYYPLKCYHGDKVEYECTAYSLAGTICSYSDATDLVQFMKNVYLTEEGCQKACDKMNQERIEPANVHDSDQYIIIFNSPSPEDVCKAAMDAIMNKKKGRVVVRSKGHVFLSVDGYINSGDFDQDVLPVWQKYCEKYGIWDEFEEMLKNEQFDEE